MEIWENMYQNNNNSEAKPKGCKRSCCSCSCMLIIVVFVLFTLGLIYAAYYWCWNIDNRILEKLKSGELNSNNAYEYIISTAKDYFFPNNSE